MRLAIPMKRLARQQMHENRKTDRTVGGLNCCMYAYRHSINVVDLFETVTAEGRGHYTHING